MESTKTEAVDLSGEGYIRKHELLTVVPWSSTTLWRRIKSGDFPTPSKALGPRICCWKKSVIRDWLNSQAAA